MPTTSPDNIDFPSNAEPQKTIEQRIQDTATSVQTAFNTRPLSHNYIINGGFDIWQRGTSFTSQLNQLKANTADRWIANSASTTGFTVSRQSIVASTGSPFTQYSLRFQRNSGSTLTNGRYLLQMLESSESIPLAGRNVTFSFFARRGANYANTGNALIAQVRTSTGTDGNIFTGFPGSASPLNSTVTLSENWQRFTITGTLASSTTQIGIIFAIENVPAGTAGANDWFEISGVQLEAGSVATPFRRNQPNLQAELAACQRYYWRFTQIDNYQFWTLCSNWGGELMGALKLPVTMRVRPSLSISDLASVFWLGNNTNYSGATGFSGRPSTEVWAFACSTASVPTNVPVMMRPVVGSFIEADAEL